jgi:hypothetical protein
LAGLIAQFKPDWPSSFSLSDGCAVCRVAASGDILDPDGDDIATTKLAVDCQRQSPLCLDSRRIAA